MFNYHPSKKETLRQKKEAEKNRYPKPTAQLLTHSNGLKWKTPSQKLVGYLLFTSMIMSVLPTANSTLIGGTKQNSKNRDDETLKELINRKTFLDPSVPHTSTLTQQCEQLKNKTLNLVTQLPHSTPYVTHVLKQDGFKIACSTVQNKLLQRSESGGALFFILDKTIYLASAPHVTEASIHHEFLHASNFFYHQNSKCKITPVSYAPTPVYPLNQENINAYNNALDLGDKNIQQFKELIAKHESGKKLTSNESKLFKKYTEASRKCIFSWVMLPLTQSQHDILKKTNWENPSNPVYVDAAETLGKLEVLNIKKENGHAFALARPVDPSKRVIATLLRTQAALQTNFKDKPEAVKLGEREAMTFEGLSEEAIQIFYLDAYKLRQEFISRCTIESDEDHTQKQKLEL